MEKGRCLKREYFDRQVIFIAAVASLMVLYYANPWDNTLLDTWDRMFCSAVGGGVSIAKRIRNFYVCYVFLPPFFMAFFSCLAGKLLHGKQEYKRAFVMIDTVLVLAVTAAYISRYRSGSAVTAANPILITALAYQLLMVFACVFDKKGILTAERIIFLYISYLTAVVTMVLLIPNIGINKSIIAAGAFFLVFLTILFGISGTDRDVYGFVENVFSCLMWLPFAACIILETLFILNEKGVALNRYDRIIRCGCVVYALCSFGIVFLLRRIKTALGSFSSFGYMGALFGLGSIVYIPYSYYQYAHTFENYDHIYEIGNLVFAADTVRSGKLPILDYFSAHALSDTLPSILYALIHGDADGALSNPYGRLPEFFGLLIVFLILKKLFHKEYAVLTACLFPFSLGLIKTTSVCMAVVLAMLCALERKNSKAFVCFWITALAGVLFRYDDGINLGLGCIAALLFILIFQKDKVNIRRFILSGCFVAASALALYFLYCKISGIHAVSRMLEWISLTADSNSTWAMYDFGDAGSFAFFIAYTVVPLCVIVVLAIVVINFVGNRKCPTAAAVVIAFSICGLLFIPRTIVFHNLAIGGGKTGVLLNFIHWTVSAFALYLCTVKEKPEGLRFAAWIAAFGITLTAEGALVTEYIPDRDASLYNMSADYAWERKAAVSDDMSSIWGKERIIYTDEMSSLCKQFGAVFNTLLEDDETFLDFANITALYAFLGRERPFYVTQSPSLLTDLKSQQYYLEEAASHKVPLAVIGETTGNVVTMAGIYHNVRYYTIAEYIYRNYRPLVHAGDFTIWCELDRYEEFSQRLNVSGLLDNGYEMAGYKDNPPLVSVDEAGKVQYECQLYHCPNLGMIAYVWANYDKYNAVGNTVLEEAQENGNNTFAFSGSQFLDSSKGKYVAFECDSAEAEICPLTVTFGDSSDADIRYQCSFSVLPESNTYLIRASQDYLWFAYNIDMLQFSDDGAFSIHNVRILEGD